MDQTEQSDQTAVMTAEPKTNNFGLVAGIISCAVLPCAIFEPDISIILSIVFGIMAIRNGSKKLGWIGTTLGVLCLLAYSTLLLLVATNPQD